MLLMLMKNRLLQGRQTKPFPPEPDDLPERFRGVPELAAAEGQCWEKIVPVCPAGGFSLSDGGAPRIDLGKCVYCGACQSVCPGAVTHTRDYRLAAFEREELVFTTRFERRSSPRRRELRKLYRNSLRICQVNTGGCGACDSNIDMLSAPAWDMARFGIRPAISPKQADVLLVSGPVAANMAKPLLRAYEAMGEPKLVAAVGACAISGGIYRNSPECRGGAGNFLPVDLFIPGCPPHPLTLLEGLLRLTGRIE
jgi:Ni,Fe-hydrogenase III small subunit/NAD-dependent dihydropyrimidine dehydrogenase PreA subunit